MRLDELQARFIRYETRIEPHSVVDGDPATWRERGSPTKEVIGPQVYLLPIDSLEQAQGLTFLCPKCFLENSGPVGTHSCEVTFENRGVSDEQGTQNKQGGVRWTVSGAGLHDLTITPSILLIGGCDWHGFITTGWVTST